MNPPVINLMERFGQHYRIRFDSAYDPRNRPKDKLDPWYMEIPCRFGTIYPYGGNDLAVMMDRHPITAKQLAKIPGVEIIQDGDHEKTFRFPASMFSRIAKIVRPHRKRQYSTQERQEQADRLRQNLSKSPIIQAQTNG